MRFKTPASARHFRAIAGFANNFRAEEDQIIGKRGHKRHPIRRPINDEPKKQKRAHDPRQPFDLHRQNKKDVDDFFGIKAGKSEKQRHNQHAVGKFCAEEKRRGRRADHADKKIEGKPERAPCSLKAFANKPKKPEGENDPKTEGLRKKNIGNQPPDFAMENTRRIEIEGKTEIRVQPDQPPDERCEADNDARQSWNGEKAKTTFEFIQPGHVPHGKGRRKRFKVDRAVPCPPVGRTRPVCELDANFRRRSRIYLFNIARGAADPPLTLWSRSLACPRE